MRTFREKYRRVPIDFMIGAEYEALSPDGKLVALTMVLSPRQNQAGIYDGTLRSLEYETRLEGKRLAAAVAELEKCGIIEALPEGGWWVRPTFAWQNCNESFERGALRVLRDRYPDLLPRFREHHAAVLGRKDRKKDEDDTDGTPSGHRVQTVGTPGHSESSEQLQGSENREQGSGVRGQGTGAGGRGHAGEGGEDSVGMEGDESKPSSFSSSNQKGNGAAKREPALPHAVINAILTAGPGDRENLEKAGRLFLSEKLSKGELIDIVRRADSLSQYHGIGMVEELTRAKAARQ